MKRLKAKCWNYRDLGTKKFDGEECCETSRGVDSSRVIDEIIALARGLREIRGKMTDASVFELNVFSINESRLRKIDLPYEINRTKGDIEYKWNEENISFSRVPFGTQFIIEIFT